jgi:hypothetical protein
MLPMRSSATQTRIDQESSRLARFALPFPQRHDLSRSEPRLALWIHVFRIDACGVVHRARFDFFKLIRLPADVDDLPY